MNESWTIVITIYCIGFVASLTVLCAMGTGTWRERRLAARLSFFLPAWPVIFAYGAYAGIRKLWEAAEWGKR